MQFSARVAKSSCIAEEVPSKFVELSLVAGLCAQALEFLFGRARSVSPLHNQSKFENIGRVCKRIVGAVLEESGSSAGGRAHHTTRRLGAAKGTSESPASAKSRAHDSRRSLSRNLRSTTSH